MIMLGVVSALLGAADCEARESAPWAVETSINLRYFVDPDNILAFVVGDPARPILPSPDGRFFAFVTRRGNLLEDRSEFELSVYNTHRVEQAVKQGTELPAPVRTLLRTGRSADGAPLGGLEWARKGDVIYFSGTADPQELLGRYAKYSYSVTTGKLIRLIASPRAGAYPGFSAIAPNSAIYTIDPGIYDLQQRVMDGYPSFLLTPSRLSQIEMRGAAIQRTHSNPNAALQISVSYDGNVVPTHLTVAAGQTDFTYASISPNGELAVIALPRTLSSSVGARGTTDQGAVTLSLVNLKNGEFDPILGASGAKSQLTGTWSDAGGCRIAWSEDSRSIAVRLATAERQALDISPAKPAWYVVSDLSKGSALQSSALPADDEINCLEWLDGHLREVPNSSIHSPNLGASRALRIFVNKEGTWRVQTVPSVPAKEQGARWQQPGDQDSIRRKMNSNKSPNTYPDAPLGSWVAYPPPQALHFSSGLSLTLDESADRAQRLLASVDGRERVLVDVDASLVGVNYKKPKVFQWKTPDGQIHRGLLTLPGSIAGSRPPLVIMPQSWLLSNVFRPDGETFSAYAQQALAARGIAVLQVCRCDLPVDRVGQPVEEIASMRTLTDSAIDELSRQKLVNSDKLGAIGFSRQGAITRTLLLAPGKYRLSAASENDSFPSGLADYYWMLFDEAAGDGGMGTSGEAVQVERFHGGSFWLNKAQWNGEAADLAAANATGAMLVLFHGVAATPFLQSVHYVTSAGAFLSAGRPIEFHDLPDAGHVIDRPRQRYASLSLNVDWMDFWLNDHERVDPQTDAGESKEQLAAQYARWRDMKSRWNRQRAWETAGHPAGSIPDPDFVIPRASMQR